MKGKVKGCNYAAADEEYNTKKVKKEDKKARKIDGVGEAFKKVKNNSTPPKLKAQKKVGKLKLKKGEVY